MARRNYPHRRGTFNTWMAIIRNIKNRTFFSLVISCTLLGGCSFFAEPEGELAPPFQATIDPKGETYSLLDLTHYKPVIVLFTKVDTEQGKAAIKFTEKMIAQYGPDVQILIIAPIAPLDIMQWQDEFPSAAPILPDPDRSIGMKYQIKGNPSLVLVGSRCRLLGQWDGINPDIIADLESRMKIEIEKRGWKKTGSDLKNVPTFSLSGEYFEGRTPGLPPTRTIIK